MTQGDKFAETARDLGADASEAGSKLFGRIPKTKRAKVVKTRTDLTPVRSTSGPDKADAKIGKPKRAATEPTAEQLRKAADRARDVGIPQLADKYDKVAADTARYEALAREHGADISEEVFNEVLKKVGRVK